MGEKHATAEAPPYSFSLNSSKRHATAEVSSYRSSERARCHLLLGLRTCPLFPYFSNPGYDMMLKCDPWYGMVVSSVLLHFSEA